MPPSPVPTSNLLARCRPIAVGSALAVSAGLVLLLTACGSLPQSVPALVIPGSGSDVEVAEIRRLAFCASASNDAAVTLLADSTAVRDWQTARGVDLIAVGPLPAGPFAVVEHGARTTGGYSVAVTRRAYLSGGVLKLTASFLAPKPDALRGYALTSPCVLVKLPPGDYARVEVRDPSGTRRAISPLPAAPTPAQPPIPNPNTAPTAP